MNVVLVAHSSFDENFVVGSHHLARHFARAGHTVWHIGPPVTPFHVLHPANRHYRDRLRRALHPPERTDGVISMEPLAVVPWQVARNFMFLGNLFVLTCNVAHRLTRVFAPGQIDILVIDDPRFAGLERALQPKSTFYRLTDLYSEMKHDPTILQAERRLLSHCQGVVATSQPVLQHALTLKPGLPSLLLENGVDHDHFSRPVAEADDLKAIPHPRAIYVGALDFRFDGLFVEQLARRLPHVHFVLIGEGSSVRPNLPHPDNVHILGPRPYRVIPSYLQHADVGILPFVDSAANSGRSPMKLYEYGAAGLPALARNTLELSRRHDVFVRLYQDLDEAERELRALLEAPPDRQAISDGCRTHAWSRKSTVLLDFLIAQSQGRKSGPAVLAS